MDLESHFWPGIACLRGAELAEEVWLPGLLHGIPPASVRMTNTSRASLRLACCCGLRASEIAQFQLDDVFPGFFNNGVRVRTEKGACSYPILAILDLRDS